MDDDPCDDITDTCEIFMCTVRAMQMEKYTSKIVIGARVLNTEYNAKIARAVADVWVRG